MKKLILILAALLLLVGCNYSLIDTNYKFDTAVIRMPDGAVKEVPIKSWADSEGEQLTIVSTDGTVYLVSSFNCVMIKGGTQ